MGSNPWAASSGHIMENLMTTNRGVTTRDGKTPVCQKHPGTGTEYHRTAILARYQVIPIRYQAIPIIYHVILVRYQVIPVRYQVIPIRYQVISTTYHVILAGIRYQAILTTYHVILATYQEAGTKVSSPVVPPSTSHAGAHRRWPHPPLSTPQWSLSPAAAPLSSTPHARLVVGGHVFRRHVPHRSKSSAAASSPLSRPTPAAASSVVVSHSKSLAVVSSVISAPCRSSSPAASSSAVTPHVGGCVIRRQRPTPELVASGRSSVVTPELVAGGRVLRVSGDFHHVSCDTCWYQVIPVRYQAILTTYHVILATYQEAGTKVSSPVVPPSTSHAGAHRRWPHPPLSTPQWSLSPAAAPLSSTPHARLVVGGHVFRRHVPHRSKSSAAASSPLSRPTPAAASSVVVSHVRANR
uniref:Uncharacterized protein n=1 Tax=Oryza punctata TaxID=4537 RepID=A0A0E0KTP3_ORYPU